MPFYEIICSKNKFPDKNVFIYDTYILIYAEFYIMEGCLIGFITIISHHK